MLDWLHHLDTFRKLSNILWPESITVRFFFGKTKSTQQNVKHDRVSINHFIKAVTSFVCNYNWLISYAYISFYNRTSVFFLIKKKAFLMDIWQWCFCHLPICFQFLIVKCWYQIESNKWTNNSCPMKMALNNRLIAFWSFINSENFLALDEFSVHFGACINNDNNNNHCYISGIWCTLDVLRGIEDCTFRA